MNSVGGGLDKTNASDNFCEPAQTTRTQDREKFLCGWGDAPLAGETALEAKPPTQRQKTLGLSDYVKDGLYKVGGCTPTVSGAVAVRLIAIVRKSSDLDKLTASVAHFREDNPGLPLLLGVLGSISAKFTNGVTKQTPAPGGGPTVPVEEFARCVCAQPCVRAASLSRLLHMFLTRTCNSPAQARRVFNSALECRFSSRKDETKTRPGALLCGCSLQPRCALGLIVRKLRCGCWVVRENS